MHASTPAPIVIVGAGHCGGRTAQLLRANGWSGPIDLVGDEPGLPYERPPLSKGVLTGSVSSDALNLLPAADFAALDIRCHQSSATALDVQAQRVQLANGTRLHYGSLLLAQGGRVRRLEIPGAHSDSVHYLRTKADAQALLARLQAGRRLLVIGGGFIGLEVAASARSLGCEVHLIEGAKQLMGRAVSPELAARAQALHQERGVDIRLGVQPLRMDPADGGVSIALSDGAVLQVDAVLVGIGIVPATALARDAGLAVRQGIVVNHELRTQVHTILAAGDVAEFPSPVSGTLIRQETWSNAEAQARVAARNLMGASDTFSDASWFWSDQYDHQLQSCGEPGAGTHTVTRALGEGDVLMFYLDDNGRIVGASGWGLSARIAKELKLARALVERAVCANAVALADPQTRLKALLK